MLRFCLPAQDLKKKVALRIGRQPRVRTRCDKIVLSERQVTTKSKGLATILRDRPADGSAACRAVHTSVTIVPSDHDCIFEDRRRRLATQITALLVGGH